MNLNVLSIFASILIVSAAAGRYNQGLQKSQYAGPEDAVLYLTNSQIEALETSGVLLRPEEPENDSKETSEEAQQTEDQAEDNAENEQVQDQEQEQVDNENEAEQAAEQQEEPEQPDQENENLNDWDIDLEEIVRILNEEQIEQEEANEQQVRNEPQVTNKTSDADNSKEERPIPLRFQLRQNQQHSQAKLLASSEQRARSKAYAAIRFQRNEQLQKALVQFARQETLPTQDPQEQPETEAPLQKRFKLVPYEVEEQPEELTPEQQTQQAQEDQQELEVQQQAEEQRNEQQENEEKLTELLTPLLSPEKLAEFIGQRKNRLSQNELELQAVLKELKQSSKYNDQKYAIEIERLRANLQKQNALAKAEAVAKAAPHLIQKAIQKQKPTLSAKLTKAPASGVRKPELQKQRTSKPQSVRPVSILGSKNRKVEVSRPTQKRVPVTTTSNVDFKVNTRKPFPTERTVPVETKKETPVKVSVRKSQRVILS